MPIERSVDVCQRKFASFNESVSDAWAVDEAAEDCLINSSAAHSSAQSVLQQHATLCNAYRLNGRPHGNSSLCRTRAMQRLAIQKEPLPQSAVTSTNKKIDIQYASLYPKLPELDSGRTYHSRQCPCENLETARQAKIEHVLQKDRLANADVEELKKECWRGISPRLRPSIWRILSGYAVSNARHEQSNLRRKRGQYFDLVEAYFHTRSSDEYRETFRQIQIDIPRMSPLVPLFQQKVVQEMFERILYIWAYRHPASGYVQGINDLVTPFFIVFLSERNGEDIADLDLLSMSDEERNVIEADSYWCVSALLDTIQDNYTFAQPGIQKKVTKLETLVSRVDSALNEHLRKNQVEYLQFAFRWMNNLLMRELPLSATIRLWDTYLCENNGFAEFHLYVCAAFLCYWSKQIQEQHDFQSIMLLIQNLPTQHWGEAQISELTAKAFSLMYTFSGAKSHLSVTSTKPS
ncbi:unnamed protein product [Soboliphyme baturini]|uniref:Rab-GAP TBC domain-containing protein n=1 Tax=Soboliphyme baturini TaxID=241478 RepID=A0A183IPJ9_9BILA|nr:unnamed protein product [Soboliphyme baturini]